MYELRPVRDGDLEEMLGGEKPPLSYYGRAIEVHGKLASIGGVCLYKKPYVFMEIREEFYDDRRHQKLLLKACKQMMDYISQHFDTVYAFPETIDGTAPGFLRHYGFRSVPAERAVTLRDVPSDTSEVYVWQRGAQ